MKGVNKYFLTQMLLSPKQAPCVSVTVTTSLVFNLYSINSRRGTKLPKLLYRSALQVA